MPPSLFGAVVMTSPEADLIDEDTVYAQQLVSSAHLAMLPALRERSSTR
jgi:hypothetical protein